MTRNPKRPVVAAAALVLVCVAFAAGVATSVLAGESARTYSTKGKVVSVQGGRLLLKDKFGVDWEYELPKSLQTSVGKEVKVVYTMHAVKLEAPTP